MTAGSDAMARELRRWKLLVAVLVAICAVLAFPRFVPNSG
jgi:hypothetical protein